MDDSGCCCVPPAAAAAGAASDHAALTEAALCTRDPLPDDDGDVAADAGADDDAVEFLLPISKRSASVTR